MLENQIKVGGANIFARLIKDFPLGTGGFCSQNVENGIVDGKHKFLPFIRNGINWVVSGGEDVLSGPFTGCIMAAYKENGVRKVCHVSTGAEGDCKKAWEQMKGEVLVQFSPSDLLKDAEIKGYGGGTPRIYGLITSTGDAYMILADEKIRIVRKFEKAAKK